MKSIFSTQNLQTFFLRKYWRLPRRGPPGPPPGPPGPPGPPSRRPPPPPPPSAVHHRLRVLRHVRLRGFAWSSGYSGDRRCGSWGCGWRGLRLFLFLWHTFLPFQIRSGPGQRSFESKLNLSGGVQRRAPAVTSRPTLSSPEAGCSAGGGAGGGAGAGAGGGVRRGRRAARISRLCAASSGA